MMAQVRLENSTTTDVAVLRQKALYSQVNLGICTRMSSPLKYQFAQFAATDIEIISSFRSDSQRIIEPSISEKPGLDDAAIYYLFIHANEKVSGIFGKLTRIQLDSSKLIYQ